MCSASMMEVVFLLRNGVDCWVVVEVWASENAYGRVYKFEERIDRVGMGIMAFPGPHCEGLLVRS